MTLKTVEDITKPYAVGVDQQGRKWIEYKDVIILRTTDREAIATALLTALEGKKSNAIGDIISESEGAYIPSTQEIDIETAHNQALDQAITLVKKLLTPTV